METAYQDRTNAAPESRHESFDGLLRAVTPELYRSNAFRIASLSVEASPRDISRQIEKLKMMEKLGASVAAPRSLIDLDPPPSADALREALQRLGDPEQRLVDELFWFWPLTPGQAKSDEGLLAIARGEIQQAEDSWLAIGSNDVRMPAARHNLAIFNQLLALDAEARKVAGDASSNPAPLGLRWKLAISTWAEVLDLEGVWSRLTDRVREIGDPRLTTGAVRRIRSTMPLALTSIHAQLSVRFAEKQRTDDARRQRNLLEVWARADSRSAGVDRSVINEAVRRSTAPLQRKLTALCETAKASAEKEPVQADRATASLLDQAQPLLSALTSVVPADSPQADVSKDEVALSVMSCLVAYGNKTEDWLTSAALLRRAEAIAGSDSARSRIRDNVELVERNAQAGAGWCGPGYFNLPAPVLALLEQARAEIDADRFDDAIPSMVELLMGRSILSLSAADQRHVRLALAYAFNRRCTRTINPALAAYKASPDRLREKLAARARAGKIDDLTVHAANMFGSLPANTPISCMACGAGIYHQFYRVRINDDFKALICPSCSHEQDQQLEQQKETLRIALRVATESVQLAVELEPDDKTYRGNLDEMRGVGSQLGGVAVAQVAELRVKYGLADTASMIELLSNPRVGSAVADHLVRTGASVLPQLLSEFPRAYATLARVLRRIGPAAVDGLIDIVYQTQHAEVRGSALSILGEIGDTRALRPLLALLQQAAADVDRNVCLAAIQAAGAFGPAAHEAVWSLITLAHDGDDAIRAAAVTALGNIGHCSREVLQTLVEVYGGSEALRLAVLSTLSLFGAAAASTTHVILTATRDRAPAIQKAAEQALLAVAPELARKRKANRRTIQTLSALGAVTICGVAVWLGLLFQQASEGGPSSVTRLHRYGLLSADTATEWLVGSGLVAPGTSRREAALHALPEIDPEWSQSAGATRAVSQLLAALTNRDDEARTAAKWSLARLGDSWTTWPATKVAAKELEARHRTFTKPAQIEALGILGPASAPLVPYLVELAGTGDDDVAKAAVAALRACATSVDEALRALHEFSLAISRDPPKMRRLGSATWLEVAKILSSFPETRTEGIALLIALAGAALSCEPDQSTCQTIRREAIVALGQLGSLAQAAIPTLLWARTRADLVPSTEAALESIDPGGGDADPSGTWSFGKSDPEKLVLELQPDGSVRAWTISATAKSAQRGRWSKKGRWVTANLVGRRQLTIDGPISGAWLYIDERLFEREPPVASPPGVAR